MKPSAARVRGRGRGRGARSLARDALQAGAATTLALATCTAWAQLRPVTLTPGFSASQIVTDNRDLSDGDPQTEAVTVLSPTLRLGVRSARVQASLDYALSGLFYARESAANEIQTTLRASLGAELVPQYLSVQAQATVGQQAVSALDGLREPQLGTGTAGVGFGGVRPSLDRNRAEVRTLSVSPTLRGRPFGEVDFRLTASASVTDVGGNNRGNSSAQQVTVSLGDDSRQLGWGIFAGRSVNDFRQGRKTTADNVGLRLSYNPWPELSVFVNGGLERNDIRAADVGQSESWGGGLSWRAGPRTQVSAQANRQFFGDGWSLNASHRFRRAVLSYGDSRNVTGTTTGAGATLSVYELFFQQFASLEPDPALRDVLVRDFLRASGLDPDERINAGFLVQALSVQRSRNLGMSLSGVRTNLVLSVFATSTRRIDRISNAVDDLSNIDLLRQYGATASVSRRLTPTSAIVLSGGGQRTRTGNSATDSGIKFASLSWTGGLGSRTGVSAGLRHAVASGVRPYDVTSLNATLNYRF